jgi:hypothetical protein
MVNKQITNPNPSLVTHTRENMQILLAVRDFKHSKRRQQCDEPQRRTEHLPNTRTAPRKLEYRMSSSRCLSVHVRSSSLS